MKKLTKKFVVIGSVITLCFNCLGMTSFAEEKNAESTVEITAERMKEAQAELDSLDLVKLYEETDWKKDTNTFSEFEIYERLANTPSAQLEEYGYTLNEIATIRNFRNELDEHVRQMNTLDDNTLREFQYTPSQIDAIRNYDGSDEALSRAAATVSLGLNIDYCTYNASTNRTSSRIRFNFSWNGQPFFKMKDMMTVGWDDWYQASKSANVQYKYIYSGGTTKNQTPTYVEPSNGKGYGGGYKFNAVIDDNYYYAQNGNCAFVLDCPGEKDMHTIGVFAHQTLNIEPSFSVSVTPSGGTPSLSIKLVNSTAEKSITASKRVSR